MEEHLTHEMLYRSSEVLEIRSQAKILLCGMGALGSWLADLLARQGYLSLSGVDFDKVERGNFGTQDFGKADIGRSKVSQVQRNIFRRIGVPIVPIHKKLTEANVKLVTGFDLVVDLFDNPESRELLFLACFTHQIPCLHAGMASMGYFEVKWNEIYLPPKKSPEGDAPCDYPLASNLVALCVGITAELINRFIDRSVQRSVEFWLDSLSLEVIQDLSLV